jgi:hypothetical protein
VNEAAQRRAVARIEDLLNVAARLYFELVPYDEIEGEKIIQQLDDMFDAQVDEVLQSCDEGDHKDIEWCRRCGEVVG